jgi:transcriptional regulator with XRE-family HTH domain
MGRRGVMMMKNRKDPMAKAIGVKDCMKAADMSTRQLADFIGLDADHVGKLVNGQCGLSLAVVHRLMKCFGYILLDIDGEPMLCTKPDACQMLQLTSNMHLAEAGWMVKEENDEAELLIPRLLSAIKAKDIDALVYLYEETFCDTIYAIRTLEAQFARTVGEAYTTIKELATSHHAHKHQVA